MFRVVFDTNVFISALHWKGKPQKIYTKWLENKFILVVSPFILSELTRVLRDDFGWLEEEINKLSSLLFDTAEIVSPKHKVNIIKTDPSDNHILECAISGNAIYIVSGNKHLLEIGEYDGIKIVPPADFLEIISK